MLSNSKQNQYVMLRRARLCEVSDPDVNRNIFPQRVENFRCRGNVRFKFRNTARLTITLCASIFKGCRPLRKRAHAILRGAQDKFVLDQDDLDEAERIRNPYGADAKRLGELGTLRDALAKQRMAQRKKQGLVSWRRAAELIAQRRLSTSGGSCLDQDEDEDEDDMIQEKPVARSARSAEPLPTTKPDVCKLEPEKEKLALADALLADPNARRRCGARQLSALAAELAKARKHKEASVFLRDARDFGVEVDVMQGTLNLQEAEEVFEDVSLTLAKELRKARQPFLAWRVLMELCTQDQLSHPQAVVHQLARLAINTARPGIAPEMQVEVLQGAFDANIALGKLLKADQWDELRLTLAMSLKDAGYSAEAAELLKLLREKAFSESRRKQATWILEVQSVDVTEQDTSSFELRNLWDGTDQLLKNWDSNAVSGAGSRSARPKSDLNGSKNGGLAIVFALFLPIIFFFVFLLNKSSSS